MRVAILTFESPQGNLITQRLLRRRPAVVCGIIEATTVERGQPTWRSTTHIALRSAPGFFAWKLAEAAVSRAAWQWQRGRRRRAAIPTLADLAAEFGVPLVGTRDVNDAATLAVLRDWRLDLGFSVHFNHRIGAAAIAIPRLGMLNVHGALLPKNRGLFPYFWELANGDTAAGVTVHWVDERLDTGDVVLQRPVPIDAAETVSSLSWKGAELAAELAVEALDRVANGAAPRAPQAMDGAGYFSWPTRADLQRLHARGRSLGSVSDAWRRILVA